MAFDPVKMGEALSAGCSDMEALATAGGTISEWAQFQLDNPEFRETARQLAASVPANAKIKIAQHMRSPEVTYQDAMQYLGVVQPKEWSQRATLNLTADKPFILLPSRAEDATAHEAAAALAGGTGTAHSPSPVADVTPSNESTPEGKEA